MKVQNVENQAWIGQQLTRHLTQHALFPRPGLLVMLNPALCDAPRLDHISGELIIYRYAIISQQGQYQLIQI